MLRLEDKEGVLPSRRFAMRMEVIWMAMLTVVAILETAAVARSP